MSESLNLPQVQHLRYKSTICVNANAYGNFMSDIALDKDQIEWKIWYDNSLNILWIDVCHNKACMIDSMLHTICTVSTHWILHLSSPPFWRRPRKLEIRYQPAHNISPLISFYFSTKILNYGKFHYCIKRSNIKFNQYEYHRGNKLDEYSILGQDRHRDFWMCYKVRII